MTDAPFTVGQRVRVKRLAAIGVVSEVTTVDVVVLLDERTAHGRSISFQPHELEDVGLPKMDPGAR